MDRKFYAGQRIIWDSRDVGTIVKVVDNHSCVVHWDNPKLGRTMAPMWSSKFQPLIERIGPVPSLRTPIENWGEDTIPEDFWHAHTK